MIESSVTIGEYFYDGDGKRVKKIAGSEETIFVYDAGGRLIGEYSSIVQTGSNAKTVYTTNDHLGSPRINTDGVGAVISRHDYHRFGEEVPAPATAPTPSANSSPATNATAKRGWIMHRLDTLFRYLADSRLLTRWSRREELGIPKLGIDLHM